MAGTFKLRADSVSSNIGGWRAGGAYSIVQAVQTLGDGKIVKNDLAGDSGTLRFSCKYYLDGSSSPTEFTSLTAGFTPLTAVVNFNGTGLPFAGANGFLQFDALTESPAITTDASNNASFAYPGNVPSALVLYLNGMGFRLSAAGVEEDIDFLEISGTYAIISSPSPPPGPNLITTKTPVYPGNKVQLSNNDNGFGGVEAIQLSWTDPGQPTQTLTINIGNEPSLYLGNVLLSLTDFIISQAGSGLSFYMPYGFNSLGSQSSRSVTVTLIGNGTQFSGSVVAGTLTVLFDNASGIYTLVEDQTNDVLYSRLGYTTNANLTMIPNIQEDEVSEFEFYSMLGYPTQILSQDDVDDGYEDDNYFIVAASQVVAVTQSVEIPSPFIKTAFIP